MSASSLESQSSSIQRRARNLFLQSWVHDISDDGVGRFPISFQITLSQVAKSADAAKTIDIENKCEIQL